MAGGGAGAGKEAPITERLGPVVERSATAHARLREWRLIRVVYLRGSTIEGPMPSARPCGSAVQAFSRSPAMPDPTPGR